MGREFLKFGAVGAVGFVVDTLVLYAVRAWTGIYLGRVFSFLCAAYATWQLNRRITFRRRRSALTRSREWMYYLTLMIAGGSFNLGVYFLLVSLFPAMPLIVGVAAGSLSGMGCNFLTSRFLLFRHHQDHNQG